jgi:hypothetical protein
MTGLETKILAFGRSYRTYPEGERKAARCLLKAIFEATERSDFSHLSADLMPVVLSLVTSIAGGKVGDLLVLAVEKGDSVLRDEIAATLGGDVWVRRVANARSALS